MGYFCSKNTFLQLKHYKQMIYFCENSPNYFMSFLKPQVTFRDTTPLYFFSSNIAYFLKKQYVKVHIFRLSTARIKVHQIPHVIFGTKSQFSSNFALLFTVMRHNSFVHFHLNLSMIWTKEAHQSTNFQTFECLLKN